MAGVGVESVREHVDARPGVTPAALATELGGRRATALASIRAAMDAELVHEAPTRVPTRGGATRTARGLYPGPAPKAAVAQSRHGAYLRPLRDQLRLPAAALARELEVATSLVYHWESGRQPMPGWAVTRLDQALERATVVHHARLDDSRRRQVREHRTQLLRQVGERPGLTLVQLAAHLEVNRRTLTRRLEPLLEAGKVHRGRPAIKPRRGGYPGLGIYPGPMPEPAGPVPTPAELAALAAEAGWPGRRVARLLDMPDTTWFAAVSGRPLPAYVTDVDMAAALVELEAARRSLESNLLAHITEHPGVTYEHLTRQTFGRNHATRVALDRLLERGEVHYGSEPVTNANGVTRFLQVLRPGPAAHGVAALSGAELEEMRRARRVSQRTLAAAVGVSKTQVAHWEQGSQPISVGRSVQLVAFLESQPVHREPLRAAERFTDDQLADLAMAYVTEHPGVTARALAREALRGAQRRRLYVIDQLMASGRLVARPVQVSRQGLGDTRPGNGLFLP